MCLIVTAGGALIFSYDCDVGRQRGITLVNPVRYLTASSHESMKSLACSQASSTAFSVYSTISDRHLNVTDSSNSLAV